MTIDIPTYNLKELKELDENFLIKESDKFILLEDLQRILKEKIEVIE